MTHFAYPNINRGVFIGCGRFAALRSQEDGYREPESNMGNKGLVEGAAAELARYSGQIEKTVYECQDEDRFYVGKSMQGAYMLADIGCHRDLKLLVPRDIWCSTEVEYAKGITPRFKKVGQKGFPKKLEAFLKPENPDTLFIVSAGNMEDQALWELCQGPQYNARVLTLDMLPNVLTRDETTHDFRFGDDIKTVLLVRPNANELYTLVNRYLFQLGQNPYKGLEHFEQEDAVWFFGQETVTERLFHQYLSCHANTGGTQPIQRFVAIVGSSGNGKSSLARAGLLPQAARHHFPDAQPPVLVVCKPGEQPLRNLAAALAQVTETDAADHEQPDITEHERRLLFETTLRQSQDGLVRIAPTLTDVPILLLVDQFEQLFRDHAQPESSLDDECSQYIANLLTAASDPNVMVSVVIVLRIDFQTHISRHYPELDNAIARNHVLVPVMGPEQFDAIIRKPAHHAGNDLDEETIACLLSEVSRHPRILPLLQFTLKVIWEGIEDGTPPRETLNALGSIGEAVASRADFLYDSLHDEEQAIVRRILPKLVSMGDSSREYTGHPCRIQELKAHHEEDTSEIVRVLRKFEQPEMRLITLSTDDETGDVIAELTHDALCRHWKRFADWLEKRQKDAPFAIHFTRHVERWDTQGREPGQLWAQSPDWENMDAYSQTYQDELTQEQLQFIQASNTMRTRKTWTKRIVIGLLVILTTLFGVYWARADRAAAEAKQAAEQVRQQADNILRQRNTIARNLTSSARNLMQQDDQLPAVTSILKAINLLNTEENNAPKDLSRFIEYTFQDISLELTAMNQLQQHTGTVFALTFSPDGEILASAGTGGDIWLWDPLKGSHRDKSLNEDGETVFSLAFQPHTGYLLSGHVDGTVQIWDIEESTILRTFHVSQRSIESLTVNVQGDRVAAADNDGHIFLWDFEEQRPIQTLQGHTGAVYQVAFSPDGHRLASAGHDGTIRIWDTLTGQEIQQRQSSQHPIYTVAFSPDGSYLAFGGQDQIVTLWHPDQEGDRPMEELKKHDGAVYHLAFDAEGQRLASVSQDHTVIIWDVQDGTPELCYGHEDAVYEAAFHPQTLILATAGRDASVRLWQPRLKPTDDMSVNALVQANCQRIQGYLLNNPDAADDRDLCRTLLDTLH